MLKTPESKAAHAGIAPGTWREPPSIQTFDTETTWHPATMQA